MNGKRSRNRTIALALLLVAVTGGRFLLSQYRGAGGEKGDGAGKQVVEGVRPQRIVSLAPSITEILFALGMGDHVVGVTKFCEYPPQAKEIDKIGGFVDPNYEAIVMLKPDLAILLHTYAGIRAHLDELKIPALVVDHRSIDSILASIHLIGRTCSLESRAEEVVQGIRDRVSRAEQKTLGRERPRVLVCIGRSMGTGSLSDVYIAGKDGFYDELIRLAGGANAYQTGRVAFPMVTAEGILEMDPQVIVDMIPKMEERGWSLEQIRNEWRKVGSVSAVRTGRIHVITEDYGTIPGPRFGLLVESLSGIIHPMDRQEKE